MSNLLRTEKLFACFALLIHGSNINFRYKDEAHNGKVLLKILINNIAMIPFKFRSDVPMMLSVVTLSKKPGQKETV